MISAAVVYSCILQLFCIVAQISCYNCPAVLYCKICTVKYVRFKILRKSTGKVIAKKFGTERKTDRNNLSDVELLRN